MVLEYVLIKISCPHNFCNSSVWLDGGMSCWMVISRALFCSAHFIVWFQHWDDSIYLENWTQRLYLITFHSLINLNPQTREEIVMVIIARRIEIQSFQLSLFLYFLLKAFWSITCWSSHLQYLHSFHWRIMFLSFSSFDVIWCFVFNFCQDPHLFVDFVRRVSLLTLPSPGENLCPSFFGFGVRSPVHGMEISVDLTTTYSISLIVTLYSKLNLTPQLV